MSKKSSIGVLVSGGLDSAVLLAESCELYHHVWPIYVRQGLAWESVELYWLRKFISALKLSSRRSVSRGDVLNSVIIFELPMADLYGRHWSTGHGTAPGARTKDEAVYLPGRNMALSIKPAIFCVQKKIPTLVIGSLDHNPFPDARPSFFKSWGNALSKGLGCPLKIMAPYRTKSKADVIRRGKAWPLHLSFSCIAPKGKLHCGRCNKCAERRRAFKAAGVEDRTFYVKN